MDSKTTENKNYYQILGLPSDASPAQIKEVYRDLARAYHPDSNFYSEILEQGPSIEQIAIFKIITAAYNTLIDPNRRADYDRLLASEKGRGRLKGWEHEQTQDFWPERKPRLRSRKTTLSRRSGVFGRPEFQRAAGEDAEESVAQPQPSPSVAEIMKHRIRLKLWAMVLAALGLLAGLLLGAILYLLHSGARG